MYLIMFVSSYILSIILILSFVLAEPFNRPNTINQQHIEQQHHQARSITHSVAASSTWDEPPTTSAISYPNPFPTDSATQLDADFQITRSQTSTTSYPRITISQPVSYPNPFPTQSTTELVTSTRTSSDPGARSTGIASQMEVGVVDVVGFAGLVVAMFAN
ncbi:hypothetical protein BDV96DRAFT_356584 [Lophiotrema nucula]|uniref:Uncharacterized protein n=1 Tax=Lophiotrema nucula TaxID=690887 RepID=A0A6A5YFM9_9PLEO|nr:hypothetical protein BDV96DRAFT_356584 [Lophiotrema nucula]